MERITSSELLTHLDMYQVSGQDAITVHDLKRYERDKLAIEEDIVRLAQIEDEKSRIEPAHEPIANFETMKANLADSDTEKQKHAIGLIRFFPTDKRAALIRTCIRHSSREVQDRVVHLIYRMDPSDRISLMTECLDHENPRVRFAAAQCIQDFPVSERDLMRDLVLEHIHKDLADTDSEVQATAIELIPYAPTDAIPALRMKVLEYVKSEFASNDQTRQRMAVSLIRETPEDAHADLIQTGLAHSDPEVQIRAARALYTAPKQAQANLMSIALTHSNQEVVDTAIDFFWMISSEAEIRLQPVVLTKVLDWLAHSDPAIQEQAVKMIPHVAESEQLELIKQALQFRNPKVKEKAIHLLWRRGSIHEAILWPILLEQIETDSHDSDPNIQAHTLDYISYLPEASMVEVINTALDHPNQSLALAAAKAICFITPSFKDPLFEKALTKGLGAELIKPPLYNKSDLSEDTFSRAEFEKTGSRTVLLGGDLKDKTIIREIEPEAFTAWQEIYEDWQMWETAGFDYVPIEPIQSFTLGANNLVRVYSGVLDLNFSKWRDLTTRYTYNLYDQINQIRKLLNAKDFEHGHDHEANFCLRFFRDDKGQPDFNRQPRLYLIDFDQAVSPGIT